MNKFGATETFSWLPSCHQTWVNISGTSFLPTLGPTISTHSPLDALESPLTIETAKPISVYRGQATAGGALLSARKNLVSVHHLPWRQVTAFSGSSLLYSTLSLRLGSHSVTPWGPAPVTLDCSTQITCFYLGIKLDKSRGKPPGWPNPSNLP